MTKIFISYAHEDEDSAARLYRELITVKGIDPWFDKESLGPGMRWKPAIRKNIRESDFFIALLSTKSGSRRGFVHTELNTALEVLKEFPEGQIYLIPIRLDDCPMPVEELREIQYDDFFPDWNLGMTKVLKAIGTKVSHESKATEKDTEMSLPDEKRAIVGDLGVERSMLGHLVDEKSMVDYEYRVGIVDLDLGLANLTSMASHLNSIQHYFRFTCPTIQTPKDAVQPVGGFSNFVVDLVPPSFYEERQYIKVDLVACLTKYPLAFNNSGRLFYNYFSSPAKADERFMFLSLSELDTYSKTAGVTFEKGIAHLILAQLVEYFTQLGFHPVTRGCLMDFCGKRSDIIQGLKERKFCSWCLRKVRDKEFRQSVEAILKSDIRI